VPNSNNQYPPIGDYAVIGDCHTAVLVSRQGAIEWCCMPRFDSGSAFGAILDRRRGGACTLTPVGPGPWEFAREYLRDTLVLETSISGSGGKARLRDCMIMDGAEDAGSRRQILRVVEGMSGAVEFEVRVAPRFDYGQVRPWIRRHGHRLHSAIGGNDALVIWSEHALQEDPEHELVGRIRVGAHERAYLSLQYCSPESIDAEVISEPDAHMLEDGLKRTIRWWRQWSRTVQLDSRDEAAARRSGITLKALTYAPTGAAVAAATTSLPEAVGGVRNWDYRFAWVRDSSFSSRAFAELGCDAEADAFRAFIMRSAAGHAGDLQVLYGVGGERRIRAEVLDELEGYAGSAPVHIGNDAAGQLQLDAYGELVNLTWRWHRRGHSPGDDDWRFLLSLIDHAAEHCEQPDWGLWEWPGKPQHFVHSKVLCWSALDRGIRLADECMRRAPTRRWKQTRDKLRRTIERRGYDRKRGIFVQCYDRPELDAALLLLPTVEFVDWRDERMIRTTEAIWQELGAGDGLLYRYRRRDGLKGREGAFLCCSFWLAECLARQDKLEDARSVFDKALGRANDLGLFSEEIDPRSGALLGNFPQALTHLAHIDAAVALKEAEQVV
jgi:GH15 family glucan-1,4-alpha-glucosidase